MQNAYESNGIFSMTEKEGGKPKAAKRVNIEYCEQIEPPVRMIEPASAINRATQCNRESH